MKVSFVTLGCRMNQFDTDLMRSRFLESGYEVVDSGAAADVYVINTCTVTAGGDRASRQAIYRAKRLNPEAVVVATGCYAQVKPEELLSLEEVDLVVGNTHKGELLKIVEDFIEERRKRAVVGEIFREGEVKSFDTVLYFEESRPFLKVQEGCNKFCTFCVIPFARERSEVPRRERVLRQVELLAERGFEEIVLSGTQLSQYGWDTGSSLYQLLLEILKVEGIKLIRLSSMHIKEMSHELLELITSEERIAPHFHLSLQSASDRILTLMKRGYTRKEYERVVEYIVSRRPLSAIGTDLIVGFPTESENDFEETLRFVEDMPFAYLHLFPYSDRPFTKASRMDGKVPESVKKERLKALQELDSLKREGFYRKNRGRKLRATVLKEGRVLTENYIHVERETEHPPGRVVDIIL
ncbi:MAG: tRNA (N(6)-L-threonylcarbamoyladenosine(37)-C(2))-methylthiotransferase MtaB [Aquificota bacterium]|nr:tRNA (N(6)-L-threonylcarbamoyladenosine(37)-C(2))-methylthiotransferase MtaB [Aquificota bacterium]